VEPVPLGCGQAAPLVGDGDEIFTIGAPIRGQTHLTPGTVSRVEPSAILADFLLERGSAGGPVFAAGGAVLGITTVMEEPATAVRDTRVVRVEQACEVLGVASGKMQGSPPPGGTLLPVEPVHAFPLDALEEGARRRTGGVPAYQLSSSDFDVAFITPVLVRAARQRSAQADRAGRATPEAMLRERLLTDFGTWSAYVADHPPVLLVRVTPRLVEGFWAMVARGAAQTQGMSLPPLKRFKPGFARLRAFCGTSEVTPIHPFVLEQRLSERDVIREGLYVFDPGALVPACGHVRLALHSEKEPERGDTVTVDPRTIQQIWDDFAPHRAADPASGAGAPSTPR
jgi:hypothetical protein